LEAFVEQDLSAMVWSRNHFSGARLSDKRRIARVVEVAAAMARHPGDSIPKLFPRRYDVKAAYTLFQHPEANPDNLQAGHRAHVLDVLQHQPGEYLLIEDASNLTWGHKTIEGLTAITPKSAGFILQSVLAVRWPEQDEREGRRPPVEVIGLVDQQYYTRKPIPDGEDGGDSYARKHRMRESQLWEQSNTRIGSAKGASWVRV
jgi:hypothetical protein